MCNLYHGIGSSALRMLPLHNALGHWHTRRKEIHDVLCYMVHNYLSRKPNGWVVVMSGHVWSRVMYLGRLAMFGLVWCVWDVWPCSVWCDVSGMSGHVRSCVMCLGCLDMFSLVWCVWDVWPCSVLCDVSGMSSRVRSCVMCLGCLALFSLVWCVWDV